MPRRSTANASRIQHAYRGGNDAGEPGWVVAFTYDEALIAALKARIPSNQRAWWETRREWWFALAAMPVLRELLPAIAAYEAQAPLF